MPTEPSAAFCIDSWTIVEDGRHNAFTDLVVWKGKLWLTYVSSPSHFASRKSRIVLLCSPDGRSWKEAARFDGQGEDIRDPKLAVIDGRLFVYALLNRTFDPIPYKTVSANSSDGETWSALIDIVPEGWLLGKPKTFNEQTWFAPAHHIQKRTVALMRSTDGLKWETVSIIHDRDGADESAIEFLPDGNLQAVTRIEADEGLFGGPASGTLLSNSNPPYEHWQKVHSPLTRLDGPNLFSIAGICYAVGRFQPRIGKHMQKQGSILATKRTSLFQLHQSGLTWLTNLPSTGDTAYAGTALLGEKIFISYYTNNPGRDIPWILGMIFPTVIRLACLNSEILSARSI
jgi:hypothetical protein